MIPPLDDFAFDVTLVVPSFRGEGHIRACLESIVAQTLERDRFEVRIVVNGPPDGAVEIAEEVLGAAGGLHFELMLEERASLSNARNLAMAAARGRWVTWVDVDDWLSPNFLAGLLASAQPGIVPVATVVDVAEQTGDRSESPIARQLLELPAGVHQPVELWRPMAFAACKLLPVELARQHDFDTSLRNGEDVAYFAPFLARFDLVFDNTPAHEGATYYRQVRSGSMSRLAPSFEFSILDRIAVMRHLDEASKIATAEMAKVMHQMMRSQAGFASRYLTDHPGELRRVVRAFEQSGLEYVPWSAIRTPSHRLLISYNYPPFVDASAITAAKRAYLSGVQWNVVSQNMSGVRRRDEQLTALTGPSTAAHEIVPGSPSFASWKGVVAFCTGGSRAIEKIVHDRGPQTEVYSRAMWPASHFLAAVHVLRSEGDVRWRAEFSDPLRHDVHGKERVGPVIEDVLFTELVEGLERRGFGPPSTSTVFAWAEWLAFCLADELVFTNPLQRASMLSGIGDPDIVRRVRARSFIEPHPTLPPRMYQVRPVALALEPGLVHLGYFGSFYANRGLGSVLRALATLAPPERAVFRIHVFSEQGAEVEAHAATLGVSESVQAHSPQPYIDHLNAAGQMHALLVMDADTVSDGHRFNPFLPSKVSDYLGTGRPLFALAEPGSMLSRIESRYSARLDDLVETAAAFRRLRQDVLR